MTPLRLSRLGVPSLCAALLLASAVPGLAAAGPHSSPGERGSGRTERVAIVPGLVPGPEPGPENGLGDASAEGLDEIVWDARAARHLLNRAAFGARPNELRRALRMGLDATVDELLEGSAPAYEPFEVTVERLPRRELRDLPRDEVRKLRAEHRTGDRRQMEDFGAWWLERMIDSGHPLRERMTLFWHGHFTSSYHDVNASSWMVRQNELFRVHGLGRFDRLLRRVVRDPAVLVYLDATKNSLAKPNENLARELLELFALGEGHYTENDVRETARALTGWVRRGKGVRFVESRHDHGTKSILGVSGAFDHEQLVDVILAQEATSRWIAARLLAYFEGSEPSEQRVARYAEILVADEWRLSALLRELFHDPHFYSEAVVGQRVASPIDYLVGFVRRLKIEPPADVLVVACAQLGQQLFEPPTVQGWEGGLAWITTGSLQQRGNLMGFLLGVIDLGDVTGRHGKRSGKGSFGRGMRKLRFLVSAAWEPSTNLARRLEKRGAQSDEAIVEALFEELLAVEPSDAGRSAVVEFVRAEREALGCEPGELLARRRRSEQLLRAAAHILASLPEAQLH